MIHFKFLHYSHLSISNQLFENNQSYPPLLDKHPRVRKIANFASVQMSHDIWSVLCANVISKPVLYEKNLKVIIIIKLLIRKIYFRTIPANTILHALMKLTVLPAPVCPVMQARSVTQTLMNALLVSITLKNIVHKTYFVTRSMSEQWRMQKPLSRLQL